MNNKKLIKFLQSKSFVRAKESNSYCEIYELFDEDMDLSTDTFWIYKDCVSMDYRGHNIGDVDYASIKIIKNELWINLDGD